MNHTTTVNLLSALFVVFSAFIGAVISNEFTLPTAHGLMAGAVFGLIIVLIDRLLKGFSLRAFSAATFGLAVGLIFATLLRASGMLRYQSDQVEWIVSLALYAAFGYLGMMLAMRSNRDEFSLIIPYIRFTREAVQDAPLVIDTNIIIDGRIVDLCESKFLSGQIVVPQFILEELQLLADSDDEIRKARGRRGLDNLNRLRSSKDVSLTIHQHEYEERAVDALLIVATKFLQARLLTNDADLCKVARLQNVPVLNLNDLARAMRPVVSPGDDVEIDLVKEGRDPTQAVGYLPDGTMIVVNNARHMIGRSVVVTVGGALQTSAGRLYFAEIRR